MSRFFAKDGQIAEGDVVIVTDTVILKKLKDHIEAMLEKYIKAMVTKYGGNVEAAVADGWALPGTWQDIRRITIAMTVKAAAKANLRAINPQRFNEAVDQLIAEGRIVEVDSDEGPEDTPVDF